LSISAKIQYIQSSARVIVGCLGFVCDRAACPNLGPEADEVKKKNKKESETVQSEDSSESEPKISAMKKQAAD